MVQGGVRELAGDHVDENAHGLVTAALQPVLLDDTDKSSRELAILEGVSASQEVVRTAAAHLPLHLEAKILASVREMQG